MRLTADNHIAGKRRVIAAAATLVVCALLAPAAAQAQPGDAMVLDDNFESGTFANWTVNTSGNGLAAVQSGIGTNGSKGARLTVPDYSSNSMAYVKHTLAAPSYGLSASGRFKVLSGGCSEEAGYSAGSVPFLRFLDADGRRIAGLYRINGSCSKTAKLYVQHSGNYYRTGKNISFGVVTTAELRIAVTTPSKSLVQVFIDGSRVYESTIADNGTKPVASVNIHNEHEHPTRSATSSPTTSGSRRSTRPPSNPCDATFPLPGSTDPGTTILADNFETFDFSRWTSVARDGDATASVQTTNVRSGRCAAQLNVTSNQSSKANISKSMPTGTGSVWADGWFNVLAAGSSSSSNVPLFRLFSGTTRIADMYRTNGTGQLYLRLMTTGGTTYHSLGRIAELNRWYRVNLHVDASGSASTVRVLVDGAQVFSSAAVSFGTSAVSSVMIGSEHFAQEGVLAADDVTINASA